MQRTLIAQFKGFEFDDSFAPSTGGVRHTAPGYYLLEVADLKPSAEDNADKDESWRWVCRIIDGPENQGRTYNFFGTFKKDAQFTNASALNAIGGPALVGQMRQVGRIDTYQKFETLTRGVAVATKGKRFGALIGDGRPYNGQPTSDIQEYFPAAEYEARKASAPQVQAMPAPSGTASANGAQVSGDDLKAQIEAMFGAAPTA